MMHRIGIVIVKNTDNDLLAKLDWQTRFANQFSSTVIRWSCHGLNPFVYSSFENTIRLSTAVKLATYGHAITLIVSQGRS
jgi:hypothetical protein